MRIVGPKPSTYFGDLMIPSPRSDAMLCSTCRRFTRLASAIAPLNSGGVIWAKCLHCARFGRLSLACQGCSALVPIDSLESQSLDRIYCPSCRRDQDRMDTECSAINAQAQRHPGVFWLEVPIPIV